jgi:sporulation protein YlmC with PRC-barrel domain
VKRRRVTLQSLLGRLVLDCDGVKVGRIHDVVAEPAGDRCVVREWLLGAGALRQRLGVRALHLLGVRYGMAPVRVPWEQMDLTNPDRPRLRCRKEDLG